GAFHAFFDSSSKDATHAVFETSESLVASDTDSFYDIYERVGNTTSLVSTGPSGCNGPSDGFFDGVSDEGCKLLFDTDEQLVPAATDGQYDVYERSGGSTNLISTGPSGGNGAFPARYTGNSATGSRVWFETSESLVTGDTDTQNDVYERSGSTTTQVSTGGNGPFDSFFDGASADGSHVFFHTAEPLAGGDTDTNRDVFDRTGGT